MNIPPTVAAVALLLAASMGHAHHATTPVYDIQKTVTTTGVVTSFRLVNPHTMLTLDVTDESGKIMRWTVEFDGRLNLTGAGWTEDTLKAGDVVTVTGNPTHSGSPRMFFAELERADGTRLGRPLVDKLLGPLEDARRQRTAEKRQ